MPTLPKIAAYSTELTAIRRDLHEHPEVGFEEGRTSGIVAEWLRKWGVEEVHSGIGVTGVVGVLHGRAKGNRSVGLRADMDALPMQEATGLPFASRVPGRFHGCGHDGHTTMLLGAARYLAETRDFAGRVVLIFQPAEEGLGGARAMLEEGLFRRFPCDEVYGLHNNPAERPNRVTVKPGPAMAGATFFDVTLRGVGAHAAKPHNARDPVLVAAALVQALQSIVSRNVDPTQAAVLSVTQVHAGTSYNVLPEKAVLSGTIRYFSDGVKDLMERRFRSVCAGFAVGFEMDVEVELRTVFDVLVNDADLSREYVEAAAEIVGRENASLVEEMVTGSEDFADMLKAVPGAYCRVGHAGDVPLHNPAYLFDDALLPVGASIMARIAERRLPIPA